MISDMEQSKLPCKPFAMALMILSKSHSKKNAYYDGGAGDPNRKLARENSELKALMIDGVAPELIGKSPGCGIRQSISKLLQPLAALVNGPSGSGKELAARCIHTTVTEKMNALLLRIVRGWRLSGWMQNYLVQRACKATAGSLAF